MMGEPSFQLSIVDIKLHAAGNASGQTSNDGLF